MGEHPTGHWIGIVHHLLLVLPRILVQQLQAEVKPSQIPPHVAAGLQNVPVRHWHPPEHKLLPNMHLHHYIRLLQHGRHPHSHRCQFHWNTLIPQIKDHHSILLSAVHVVCGDYERSIYYE